MSVGERPYYVFKICLLGMAAVGKTCIAKRLCFDTFDAENRITIGIEFYTYNLPIIIKSKETYVRVSLWDFGGQEQFKRLFPYYINGVNGLFLVFDLSDLQSLIKLDWWFEQLEKHDNQNVPKIVIGAKYDLIDEENKKVKVNDLIISQFLDKHGEKCFFKTSSKENINVTEIFKQLVKYILEANKFDYDKIL